MISINNFFGVDLERMPNHTSIYKETSYKDSGECIKKYVHSIPQCDNHFFNSLEIIQLGNSSTNFIFDPIPYTNEKAMDIAFIIERDLFNNGNLNYLDYIKKNGNKFTDTYSYVRWNLGVGEIESLDDDLKIDKALIQLTRDHSELSITIWSCFHYDMNKIEENKNIPTNAKIAEDGIIEYKFGSDLYPQGCEVSIDDKDYIIPQSIEGVSFRTVKLRIPSTDERIRDTRLILENITRRKEIMFLGALLNGAFVFLDTENRIIFPMTEITDRINLLQGKYICATAKHFDTENLSSYIGFTFQIMTTDDKKTEKPLSVKMNELFSYYSVPAYLNDIIEQFKPTKDIDFLIKEANDKIKKEPISLKSKTKILSISFHEYELTSAKLEYLKSCADDNSIEFKLSLKTDKSKREYISVESINSDYPLSTEIKDECFIEDFKKHEQLVQEEMSTGKCYGVLFHYQDANSEFSSSQRIFFHIKIYMPWTQYKEIPAVPQTQQETPSLETKNAGVQKYIANLVGFKFCLKEDELDEVDKYFYDFSNVIYLKPENDNPFDPNAIAAYMDNGKKIAYVAKENAQVLRPLLQEDEEIEAQPERFNFTSAVIRMNLPCNKSLELESLFSEYKPIEVYKAHYLNVYWGGTDSLVERNIFNSNEQSINFENLLSLPIEQQNYLAVEWKDCMNKVSVENPTNFGLKMNVHLDLSIYGTSLEDIDLFDIELLDRIEEDNKKTALFVRLSREKYVSSPKGFIEEHCPDACDTLKQRLQYEHNKISK